MKELLKKWKLLEHLETELEIQKTDFINRLSQIVDEGSIDLISDSFDVFSFSKNQFKGEVNSDGFRIKRRKKLFDMNTGMAFATGTYTQKENKLLVHTEINGYYKIMILFLSVCILFYAFFFLSTFTSEAMSGDEKWITLAFIFIHAVFMFGIPYLLVRRSIIRLKYELEREFFYLIK